MPNWKREIIETSRGCFEVFVKGEGEPVCITHHYSEFNESGDYFAETFTDKWKVFLVNLKDAGSSDKAQSSYELSMVDAVLDLEEIRKVKGFSSWTFAGHSTGGMIGVLYGIYFSSSLKSLILVGSSAREYSSSSSKCIYNEGHPKYKRMQELMELLKMKSLEEDERNKLAKERTKLSLFQPENYELYFSKNIMKKVSANRLNFFSREQLIFDVTRKLSEIKTRTIILCGRHDVQCPVDFSIEMSDLIPDASLHIFEQSNHYPFLEEEFEYKRVLQSLLL
ncbi:proline iminopeptidase [Bacillus sp. FJAT-22090]|uniref:alpha/beta fold hydrolase n=1 Tax=Bacillus sp. FJAT-22090 TaxID=1581038 RepID=UPI0006ADC5CE|nr:alpha/beta hydrolase [Bacillus sp. FJAT-22090]ALC85526.1 proline iminopeptidase [Bacillus sp. FJAT-22090]